jgi:hypothetical protein
MKVFQWFNWHEQHMFKVDPNFCITYLLHLLSPILFLQKILNYLLEKIRESYFTS